MSEVRLIDANRLITELWNAMWKYEDETEKRFMESDELDVGDWFSHRTFVQNMSDIDRDVVQKQPTVDAVPVVRCRECKRRGTHQCKLFRTELNEWTIEFESTDLTQPDWFCADGKRKEQSDG